MGLIEFPSGRGETAKRPVPAYEIADTLPGVPVLPETLLRMELLIRGNAVDLSGFSEAVLSDLGATIQVLRLAGQEYGDAEDRPVRVEDCIADLGVEACLAAAAMGTAGGRGRYGANIEFWTHAREVAQYSRLLAEEMSGSITPSRAYLAGLLHSIGALPSVLGWGPNEFAGQESLSALMLAELWRFPAFLKDFFYETLTPGHYSRWPKMLGIAHQLAKESGSRCSLERASSRATEWIGGRGPIATNQ